MSEKKGEGCAGAAVAILLVLILVGVVGCGATFLLFGASSRTVVSPVRPSTTATPAPAPAAATPDPGTEK